MAVIDEARREFTSRYLADLSKAIFAVALASKLFVDLPQWLRFALPSVGLLLFLIAFCLYPKRQQAGGVR